MKDKIEDATQKIAEVDSKLNAIQEGYIKHADEIPQHASAADLDMLATRLKREAKTLPNIDFVTDFLTLQSTHEHVYAAAAAIQVRPEPKFFKPLTDFLEKLADTSDLSKMRLKIVYRLVMGVRSITIADNARTEAIVDIALRKQASDALKRLEDHHRCQEDLKSNANKSIVPLIDITRKHLMRTYTRSPRASRAAPAARRARPVGAAPVG